jgi:predicted O-methyltransferase YrrM
VLVPAATPEQLTTPRRLTVELRYALTLRALPRPVAWFHWRARRLARRSGDRFSLTSATRGGDLALLLELAAGRRRVVELGTGTAWTALALALADPLREVLTYDPIVRRERERYLALVDPAVRARIVLLEGPGSAGPHGVQAIDLLYLDSSHGREETIAEVRAWRPVLGPGALIVFDDYPHPDFPGVREAVDELGLLGSERGTLFVHEVARVADSAPD